MERLRRGDQRIADEVFHRFASRLVALARSRLDLDLLRKVDPEDVVQSAFQSFFRRQAAGEFVLTTWDSLWSLLAMITVHKAGHQIRYYRAARREAGQERSAFRAGHDSVADWEAVAREPTPSHALMLSETVEELMKSLSESEQQILALTLQGGSVQEISEVVDCSERTVRRVLERIRLELENRCDSSS
jgi:RNA polymerase sigma-70 factor (ECF subfamily)